jgi:hypothetical protein
VFSELQILLDEVERNKSILFSKLSNVATFSSKIKVWEKNMQESECCKYRP